MPYLSLVLMFELSYRNKISKIIKLFPKHKPKFILFHGNLDTSMVVYTRKVDIFKIGTIFLFV